MAEEAQPKEPETQEKPKGEEKPKEPQEETQD